MAPEDIISPVSMKNAVVGIRPIVVVARNMTDLADQLAAILGVHGELVSADVARMHVTYAEGHHARDELRRELGRHATFKGVAVHGESMLKIKGLERPVVVWDSKNIGGATTGTSLLEWIYTVLTRTTGLLIVHLSSLTEPSARAFLGRMRKDRLLFWSEEAERRFDEWSSLSRDLPL